MSATEKFHEAKQALESALLEFKSAAEGDDRDMADELNECIYDAFNGKFIVVDEE